MRYEEYQTIIDDVHDNFGRNYPDTQLRKLYRAVQDCEAWEFRSAMDTLMEEHARLPSIGQVKAQCRPYIQAAWDRTKASKLEQLKERHGLCTWCEHTGVITGDRKGKVRQAGTAFRCTKCGAADILRLSKLFVKWKDHYADKWEVRRFISKNRREANRTLLEMCKNPDGSVNVGKLIATAGKRSAMDDEPEDTGTQEWRLWYRGLSDADQTKVDDRL